MQSGGLPEMFNFEPEELHRHYTESLRNAIVCNDMVGRHNIKDISLLEDVFKFLSVNIGNLLLIKDNHEKMVVSLDDFKYSDYEGIKHIRLWELA